jgi:hypothetical protein
MRWAVIVLFLLAIVHFAWGRWVRVSGRSADERAGSDLPYLLGAAFLALGVLLLIGWALVRLFIV